MKCSGVLVNKVVGLSPLSVPDNAFAPGGWSRSPGSVLFFVAFCNARRRLEQFALRPYSERIVGYSYLGIISGLPVILGSMTLDPVYNTGISSRCCR